MNLCPCGARGDPKAACSCSPQRLAAFRDKLSRALLDRFDLVVTVPRPRAHELAAEPGEPSAPVRDRVVAARERLVGGGLPRTTAADELLDRAVERLPLSGRGRARVARVALTVAALAGADAIAEEHVGGGTRVPAAAGAGGVSELALAAFAAATGAPRSCASRPMPAIARSCGASTSAPTASGCASSA